jgi:hypothetical protein
VIFACPTEDLLVDARRTGRCGVRRQPLFHPPEFETKETSMTNEILIRSTGQAL